MIISKAEGPVTLEIMDYKVKKSNYIFSQSSDLN